MKLNKIYQGDTIEVLKTFPDESVDCIVTSPPYYALRDYGTGGGQIGLEKTMGEYITKMLQVTAELKRVLKKTGTMWWNHGDSYGSGFVQAQRKRGFVGYEKSLILQAYRLVIRMIDEQGWILRNQIIWHKPNVMPASVKDRFTVDYEPIFFFSKAKKYYFEMQYEPLVEDSDVEYRQQLREKNKANYNLKKPYQTNFPKSFNQFGRSKRTVWKIATKPYPDAHFATFPKTLIETPIIAGSPKEICKECKKPREAIIKQTPINPRPHKLHKGKSRDAADGKNPQYQVNGFARSGVEFDYKTEKLGYTDCGCNAGWDKGIVLDPFMGSGTTARVAMDLGRDFVGIELNGEYIKLAEKRLAQQVLEL